ncbi:hypothetical protein Rsub_11957 [Raphidocelis subcapitata]|uniref:Uncharacterized protein n=1 Tax=Raphidocelis subcapitata TaxID=307507 RepID=A0A2V0PN75_9CHLO|nr:hypothetical protein Rsub_11957 [Raphidocelis subcapitata]|eukprot:GBF99523.1 hypothetical protein Rsub_11957 [Raphidocelis subcapitata]
MAPSAWCGAVGVDPLLPRGTGVSPCYQETASAAALLAIAAPLFALAARRIAAAAAAPGGGAAARKRGLTGGEASYLALCALLAAIHAVHLIAALALLRDLPFHIAYHASLAAIWAAAAALQRRAAGARHAALRLLPLVGAAVAVYVWDVATLFAVYFGSDAFPRAYIKSRRARERGGVGAGAAFCDARTCPACLVWSAMMESVFASLLAVIEAKRASEAKRARAGGYEALPADDVEAAAGEAKEERTWASLFADACRYAWPEAWGLRLRVLGCVVMLVLMRFLNLAVPIFYKKLVDVLASATADAAAGRQPPSFKTLLTPWVLLYLAALFFQGGAGGGITGFINNARQWLWIPVSQDAYRRVSIAVFSHVLDLDLSFHLNKKTGEVTRVVDRGTAAIQNVLSTIVFSIAPQIIDMLAAATYLAGSLEPTIAAITFVTIGSYLPLTIIVTEWRGNFRRTMNATDNAKGARVTDALLNWETVKYFCNEDLETKRYGKAIDDYQTAEYSFSSSLNVLNVMQSAIMFAGISSGMLLCTAGVAKGTLTVGDTVLFLTLMAQLYGPLNFFGTYYRVIQQYMIDMENLLQLLETRGRVYDAPNARPLVLRGGEVEFDGVCFGYEPARTVLKEVSFRAPPSSTVAFVGATGSGKSTLTRLLFRFFDVTGGSIRVDGQDIRSVTQASLRAAIGMVPQDCVLFNDTIRYNIRYGRPDATDAEVEAAARAACIHDAIARFPKGYETMVGERGLRLSGGEKQRVAFARALLKNPPLLVLDEATSALDTMTEKSIQAALAETRENRTTFIVAHRLSTIADADLIVVLQEGAVVEKGSHAQLLELEGGLYAQFWSKQATAGGGGGNGGTGSEAGSVRGVGSVASLTELAAAAAGRDGAGGGGAAAAGGGAAGGPQQPPPRGGGAPPAHPHRHHH